MAAVSIRRLTPEHAEASAALARLHAPDLSLDQWRRLLRRDAGEESGVWGAFIDDAVHGLLAYERLEGADTVFLLVRRLAVFDLFDADRVLDRLLEVAEDLARRHGAVLCLALEGAPRALRRIIRSGCVHQMF